MGTNFPNDNRRFERFYHISGLDRRSVLSDRLLFNLGTMDVFSDSTFWICILIGYVIGSTPIGLLAGKMKGIDIRDHGSGNIGATNVLRTLGKPIGITVLVFDILKGLLPVVIAMLMTDNSEIHVAAALATILGHNFTFWLKFKGGKGIATTAGTMLPLVPIALLVAVILWILLFKVTRYVSVGSIAAALVIPLVEFIRAPFSGFNWPVLIYCLMLCALAIWKHRGNIKRLMDGTEARFSKKPKQA